jgi:hypothetical protein
VRFYVIASEAKQSQPPIIGFGNKPESGNPEAGFCRNNLD